ncbi:MAG: glycosyltransferase [Xanthobacteraceae bacterium]
MTNGDRHQSVRRPRLTVSVLTRNSEPRLAGLLREASGYADEIIVGVDAASTDRTLDVARENADKVFQFRHPGQLAPARMLPFRYASGDWILSLDDDESMEDSFENILDDLLSNRLVTHYWFKRKCIVSLDPCEYVHGSPWYPDWQLRMFRNDARLVWKPPFPHSGYRVLGPGYHEERAAILHFEPLIVSHEARREKVLGWRKAGAPPSTEVQWPPSPDIPRHPARLRVPAEPAPTPRSAVLDPEIHELKLAQRTPWGAEILGCDLPQAVTARRPFLAEVRVRNTGALSWLPPTGSTRAARLNLSCHFRAPGGKLLEFEGPRFPIPRLVQPGEEVSFICEFPGFDRPGEYLVEWDMVSEGEAWFHDLGCETLTSRIAVTRFNSRS